MKGCSTSRPVSKPIFSAVSSSASLVPTRLHSATNSASFGFYFASSSVSGWFGDSARNDMPKIVSGRVV